MPQLTTDVGQYSIEVCLTDNYAPAACHSFNLKVEPGLIRTRKYDISEGRREANKNNALGNKNMKT